MLASSVGDHAFYVYNTAKLNLVFMSRFIEPKILWIEAAPDGHIYTALDNLVIVKWNKMNKVTEYRGHTKPLVKFILSSEFIFSLAQDGEFIIFNIRTGDIIRQKRFEDDFEIMMHPTTYINKLVFAARGKVELWNIIDDKKIFEFVNLSKRGVNVTTIAQSPVAHIAGIGYSDGDISLVNLQTD